MANNYVHKSADVSENSSIGHGTKIWHNVQIREQTAIGDNCVIGKNAYVDFGVTISDNVKIQNNVSVYHGVTIEEGVFVGPHVCFTNDKIPRAINPDDTPKKDSDWSVSKTLVKKGASIGANSTILPGLIIGQFAMIGAGSVVTKNVPDFGLMYGNPAKLHGYVCKCGKKLDENNSECMVCNTKLKDVSQNDTNI